jgi:outer membrane usher protein
VQESFLLYPAYKSGHLIHAQIDGSSSLRATLLNRRGHPLALSTGYLSREDNPTKKIPFFTNREGKVFVNGLKEGRYELYINNKNLKTRVSIPPSSEPIEDLGVLQLKKGVEK